MLTRSFRACALIFLASAAWAGPPMASGANTLYPDVDNGGGTYSSSSNNALIGSIAEEVALTTSSTANNRLRSGFSTIASYPGTPLALTTGAGVSASSVTFTWDTPAYDGLLGTLQAGSSYFIRVASYTVPDTFSDFRLANISFSTSGVSPGVIVSTGAAGLQPNTTYWVRLWTRDNDGDVSYASNISTFVTLALPASLQAQSFADVYYTSATVQWVARPSLLQDVSSMTAEGYLVQASSTNFGTLSPGGVVSSSQTTNVSLNSLTVWSPSLVVFKTYYFQVGTLNWAGVPNWTTLGSTQTLFQIQDPHVGVPPFTAIDTGSIVGNWTRNGNPSDTAYNAEASTAPDFSGTVTSTTTYNLFYSSGGLLADTTYFFQVDATTQSVTSNWVSLGSTSTLAHPPAAAAVPFPAVNISSLTVRWLPNGNGIGVSTYDVVAATEAYPNSDAGNVVLSSTRPAGVDPMATLASGLSPNTSYFLYADAVNWSGASSGYVLIGSTATRPQPPASIAFQEVDYSSAVVSWSANGDPLGITTFTAVLSTVAAYPPGGAWDVAVATLPTASPVVLSMTGLSLNATYHLFVTANGFSYSAFAVGPANSTLGATPGTSPDVDTYSPYVSSFTVNWSSGSASTGYNPAGTTYYAQISLNGAFNPATSSRTFNLSAGFTGLSANTTYFTQVAAYSQQSSTWTSFANFGSTSTLAAIPATAVTTFTAVEFTSMTVSWLPGGNPLNITTYTVVLSTESSYSSADPGNVSLDTSPAGASPTASMTGLNSFTTYYLFVIAENNNGVPSDYAVLGTTRTLFSPKVWVGGTGTSWFTAANWSPAGVPGPNDSVTIAPAANVSVSAGTGFTAVNFSSLTIGSPSGAFTANLTISTGVAFAGSVLINNNAGLTQGSTQLLFINGNFTMVSGSSLTQVAEGVTVSSVNIQVTGLFDLQAGATINVNGMGYAGGPATTAGSGPQPGSGATSNKQGGGGGGHGGAGGAGNGPVAGGLLYDTPAAPIDAGSGGGGGKTVAGGAGGGAVLINAGSMNLNGVILSSGTAGLSTSGTNTGAGGGGSGGAVFLTAGIFSSNGGTISVAGGNGGGDSSTTGGGGGGGGGMAAITITGSGATCGVFVSTAGGAAGASVGGAAVAGTTGTFNATDHLVAPLNFSGSALSASSIQWSWSLTNGATDYQVFATTGGPISPPLGSAASYTAAGLAPNATVSFYVEARACGSDLADSGSVPVATLADVPATAVTTFTAVNLSSMSVAWTANGNPVNVTTYTVVLTTSTSYPNSDPENVSLSTLPAGASLSATVSGLDPNTTYYLFVAAVNPAGIATAYVPLGEAVTLASPVALQPESFVEVYGTSVTVQWVARPSLFQDVSSMTAEGYLVEASSTNFGVVSPGGVVSSSQTAVVTLSTLTVSNPSLAVFKTYYFRVATLNYSGVPNWTSIAETTQTLFQIQVPLPDNPLYTGIDTGTIVAHWTRNGNPSNTLFLAEVSTAADFSGTLTTTGTYNLFYSTAGLLADATYFFRVNATTQSVTSAWTSLSSTSTLAHPPAPAAVPFPEVDISSLSVRWLPNGNAIGVSTYDVVATTEAYPNSDAGNVVLSSTRPAGADPMATLASNLSPNTSYFLYADAINWAGVSSGFVLVGSTATRPQPPTSIGFNGVFFSSAVASWSVNGNPLGITTFTAVLSTVAAYPPGGAWDVSVATVPISSPVALAMTGLNPDTTYSLFVTADGFSYSAFAVGPSTLTQAAPPGTSPDVDTYTAFGFSGFTVNWSSGSASTGYNPAGTTYYAQISLNGAFNPATSSRTFNLSAGFTGLSINTTYFIQVAAYSQQSSTWTSFTNFGSTSTLAAIPATAVTTFTAVEFTSMTVSWLPNGNPLNITTYTVVLSTESSYSSADPGNVSLDTAPGGANPMASMTGLNSATTYYLFVIAENNNDVPSAYAVLGSTLTLFSPKTWGGGAGDNNWYTAANWIPSGVPGPTDGVTIAPAANVSVNVSAGSPAISFSSLTIGSPSGAFSANLTLSTGVALAGSVRINNNAGLTQGSTQLLFINGDFTMVSGSSLTQVAQGVTVSSVNIQVTGLFDLQAGATINVNGMGYAGGPSGTAGSGPQPGSGGGSNNFGGGGGGHGGAGGAGNGPVAGGLLYDTAVVPVDAGSGGGGGKTVAGGAGGGAVIINAGSMNLNGLILSSGTAGVSTSGLHAGAGGGGSGGAVFLTVGVFSANGGTISVAGGDGGGNSSNAGGGGGGGGGMAAIDITGSGATCGVVVSTAGGAAGVDVGGAAVAGTTGTFTAADRLVAPLNFSGSALSASSIQWTWSLTNGATDYQVFATTGGPISPPLGSAASYTAAGLAPNTTVSFYVEARACGSDLADSGSVPVATLADVPATAVTTFTAVNANSMSVAWTANGNPVNVTTYTVVLTTSPAYPNSDPENVALSTLPAGASLAATLSGLDPNTTYYLFAAGVNPIGIQTAYVALGTAPTLAAPPVVGALEFLSVQSSSVTVAWIAPWQPSISSMSNEGYTLLASSNDFGAIGPPGAPVFSSTTFSSFASTLTLSLSQNGVPLDLSNTYYFQVGSINWAGRSSVSTFTRLNFQIAQSTGLVNIHNIDTTVVTSTIATSSMVVTNVGNWPATIVLAASTVTVPSSPWTLGTSSGVETAALLGVWYSGALGPPAVGPPPSAFTTYLTTTPAASQLSGNYSSASQNGFQLAPGANITLWFRFFFPTSTVSPGHEALQVTSQPVYP